MIDVLLSVKNGAEYIRESIISVLNQTNKDFILYIVDDASSDSTYKIIKNIKDKRIRLFQNKTAKGLTRNLNFLIKQSKNEFIARQDADDISHPDRFEKELGFLKKNKFDLVGSNANLIDDKGKKIRERTYEGKNIKPDLIKFNMFSHSSWFGKRKLFAELSGYDEKFKYAQDYDFLLRGVNKYRFGIHPDALIDLRWDNESLSLKHLKEQQKFALIARLNAISRGDYSRTNYVYLIKPLISYLIPSSANKYIYKFINKIEN